MKERMQLNEPKRVKIASGTLFTIKYTSDGRMSTVGTCDYESTRGDDAIPSQEGGVVVI